MNFLMRRRRQQSDSKFSSGSFNRRVGRIQSAKKSKMVSQPSGVDGLTQQLNHASTNKSTVNECSSTELTRNAPGQMHSPELGGGRFFATDNALNTRPGVIAKTSQRTMKSSLKGVKKDEVTRLILNEQSATQISNTNKN